MIVKPLEVPDDVPVHSPADFENLLILLSRLLDVGALRQLDPLDSSKTSIDLRKLSLEGPWPDIVEAEFIDSEGRQYRLFVDTFHGTGGQWRVLD